mmetsp:Transcript_9899/g.29991  ORF Transcript_9899/g.29991 Transcript_9899/m.29991 type:complete len:129 (-) Transcript_9899:339-725(-)|eukprot:CAMPEP_0198653358 /NCGR_PEP_ID=MMETSP1467-20131203/6995_1 /TAXON_ID=1462469 /ORGANISM="unid. sp., Strain CCMP2135" /LENGTH=128 /DNA_ID=CAMNT_0044389317 /DNA_START=92 /DNA_END=478 /DNA_ORIENTATION=-
MEVRPRETVVMAKDQPKLAAWYQEALGLEVKDETITEEYTYYDLGNPFGLRVGIADAKAMGVEPSGERKHNPVVLQVEVADVEAFFAHVTATGGAANFGPSFDERGFWYGGVADPEGNPIWVVDSNCP